MATVPSQIGRRHRRLRTLGFLFSMALAGSIAPALAGLSRVILRRPTSGLVDLSSIPDSILRLPRVVVLELDPDDLDGLLLNPRERGRRWERPGKVAFLSFGSLRFESPVGLRIHGGITRVTNSNQRSFRLYFRGSLQASNAPGRLVGFERDRTHQVLVLHGDVRGEQPEGEWHYINPLAYDIVRRVGALTAETAPATLIINGGPPLPYVLTEYLDLDYLEARFGHRHFEFFDTKNRTPEIETRNPVVELRDRFGERENWTFEQISQVVDMDNMSRWFIAALYCGTRDMWQGMLVRDRSRPDAKWFWVAWDFDQSFGRPPAFPYPVAQPDPVWEDDQFALHLPGAALKADERVVILDHLFRSSDSFRRWFADLFVTVRNDRLTPEFLDSVIARYEQLAMVSGISETRYQASIREWFAYRPDVVRKQVVRYTQIDIQ